MSLVSRKGLEFIINQIGRAKYAFKDLVGDLYLNRGYFLDYERIAVKFRGSTIFHDYDLAGKTTQGLTTKPYQTFDTEENIPFGLQGGKYTVDTKIASFANIGGWTPQYYNPPATEGWGVWDYNAWQYYVPAYNAAGNANTAYIIYNINSEPSNGSERTNYDYPIRWDGSLYQRVNFFNSSRWISIKNTGTTSNNEAHIIIPKSYFEGAQFINPFTNTPKDLSIASHTYLKTAGIGSTFSLGGTMAGLALTYLAYNVSEVSSTGSSTTRTKDHYLFKVKTPTTWTADYWYHLAFYWDTHDTNFISTYPSYTSGTALTFNPSNLSSTWNIYPRKTYLQKDIKNYISFDKTGVNDTNVYLFSKYRTNIKYNDGDYITTTEPFRYLYPDTFSAYGDTNSLANYISLNSFEYLPVVIATKNIISGNQYENGDIDFYLFFGKAMPLEAEPLDWYTFQNYPTIDKEYDIVAKIILSYPSFKTSGTIKSVSNTSYNLNNASIVFINRVADNFAVPSIGDVDLLGDLLSDVLSFTKYTRSTDYNSVFDNLSIKLVVPFSGYKLNKLSNYSDFSNTSAKKTKLVHNLLKYPTLPNLLSNYQSLNGSGKITIFSGSNIVVGANTKFISEITEGDYIYDLNGSELYGKVLSIVSNTYLLLEENYKSAIQSQIYTIKNSSLETEPKNITVSKLGSNAMLSWMPNPPATTIFRYDENGMYLNDISFENNTEFEFYQEISNIPDLLDQETTGSKLSKDYSFAIKFQDTSNNEYLKNVNLNSSKFFISDEEYDRRINSKVSVAGYFKQGTSAEQLDNAQGTFNSIEDYRLYGKAAIIPDLQMGESRTILSKEVEPVDSKKQTKDSFTADLKSSNPNISQAEIDLAVSNYELTNSFYIPNSNKITNQYSTITEVGMTVSNYSLDLSKYWISNFEEITGGDKSQKIFTAQNINDLRSDSFYISISGYSTSDASINSLENVFDQQLAISNSISINKSIKGNYASVNYEKFAFKITPSDYQDIKSFKIRLSSFALFQNSSAYIQCSIWDNNNSAPSRKLITGSKVFYSSIKNIFDDIYFYVNYSFTKNRTYWIVFESNTNPPDYDNNTNGLVNVSGTAVSGIYNSSNDTYANFDLYQKNASIGFGSSSYLSISNWYQISSIGNSNNLNISTSVSDLTNQQYVIKYDLRLQIQETSTPTSNNIAVYDGLEWLSVAGTPYVIFHLNDEEIYGAFNRNFKYSNLLLPTPNNTRSNNDNYTLDEYWTINNKKVFTPSLLSIYPRSFVSRVVGIAVTGNSGSNILYVENSNFDPMLLVGLGITGSSISSGTAITNLIYDKNKSQYLVCLSSNLSSSASTAYVGDNTNRYIKRANDIHIYLKYFVNDSLQTKYIKLDKSPTWITQWYQKASWNYLELDKNDMSDFTSAHYKIDINNFSGLGQSYYFNGFAIGEFTTLSSIGSTLDFRIITNGGVNFYINDEENPYISKWKNSNLSTLTTSYVATGSSQPIKLELHFNNYQSDYYLKLEWKKTGSSTWNDVDSSFYLEPSVDPVIIDANKIQNITYLAVGKNLSDINDRYLGFPATDKIVIRNK
jgi:hypothetical protein